MRKSWRTTTGYLNEIDNNDEHRGRPSDVNNNQLRVLVEINVCSTVWDLSDERAAQIELKSQVQILWSVV